MTYDLILKSSQNEQEICNTYILIYKPKRIYEENVKGRTSVINKVRVAILYLSG